MIFLTATQPLAVHSIYILSISILFMFECLCVCVLLLLFECLYHIPTYRKIMRRLISLSIRSFLPLFSDTFASSYPKISAFLFYFQFEFVTLSLNLSYVISSAYLLRTTFIRMPIVAQWSWLSNLHFVFQLLFLILFHHVLTIS